MTGRVLSLKSKTDPAWVHTALANLDAVVVDHAHCEHKAAITALSFVSKYPDDPELVGRLSALAAEEASHLKMMVDVVNARGLTLGHPDKDEYVQGLLRATREGIWEHRVDRLLICALIEARSCERLQLLAEHLEDATLRPLYDELWRVEAGHHTLFVDLAIRACERVGKKPRAAAEALVRARLDELATLEARLLDELPVRPRIH